MSKKISYGIVVLLLMLLSVTNSWGDSEDKGIFLAKHQLAASFVIDTTYYTCNSAMSVSDMGLVVEDVYKGRWQKITTGSASVQILADSFFVNFINLDQGINTFLWTSTNGSENITVNIINNQAKASIVTTSKLICANSVTLKAVDPKIKLQNAVGDWSISGQPAGNVITFIKYTSDSVLATDALAYGKYVFKWKVTNSGCPSAEDSVTIDNRRNRARVTTPPSSICGGTLNLIADKPNSNNTGVWSLVSPLTGVTLVATANTAQAFGFVQSGTYKFKWKVFNSYCPSDSQVVSVNNIKPKAELIYKPVNSNNEIVVCDTTTLNGKDPSLQGLGALTGSWILKSMPIGAKSPAYDATQYNASVMFSTPGKYVYNWVVLNGTCSSDTSSVVFKNIKPSVINAGVDSVICRNDIVLGGNVPNVEQSEAVGAWSVIAKPPQTDSLKIVDTSLYNTRVLNLSELGTYRLRWTISVQDPLIGKCATYDDVLFTNMLHPVIADKVLEFCDSLTIDYPSIKLTRGATGVSEAWTVKQVPSGTVAPATVNLSSTKIMYYDFSKSGSYTFQYALSNNGCVRNSTVTATRLKPPSFQIATDINNNCKDTIKITAIDPSFVMPATTGKWKYINTTGLDAPKILDSVKVDARVTGFTKPGFYNFQWVITNKNCSTSSNTAKYQLLNPPVPVGLSMIDTNFCGPNLKLVNPKLPAEFPQITGVWINEGAKTFTITPQNDTTTVAGIASPGVYKFVWKTLNGTCARYDTVMRRNNKPSKIDGGLDQEFCGKTEILTMAAKGASVLEPVLLKPQAAWKLISKPANSLSPVIANITNPITTVTTMDKAGDYVLQWSITNLGCVLTDDVVLTNRKPDTVYASSVNRYTCGSFDSLKGAEFNFYPFLKGTTYTWSIISQPYVSSSAVINNPLKANTTIAKMDSSGDYRLRYIVKTMDKCTVSTDAIITRSIYSQATVEQNAYYTCDDTVHLVANPPKGIGHWEVTGNDGKLQLFPITVDNIDNRKLDAYVGIDNLYVFHWVVQVQGCLPSVADVNVMRYLKPTTPKLSLDSLHICELATTNAITAPAIAANGGTPVWYRNDTLLPILNTIAPAFTGLSYGLNMIKYKIIQPNGACESVYDSVPVYRDSAFVFNPEYSYFPTLCSDNGYIQENSLHPHLQYTWSVDTIFNPKKIALLSYRNFVALTGVTSTGTYRINLLVNRGACTHRDSVVFSRGTTPSQTLIGSPFSSDTICETLIDTIPFFTTSLPTVGNKYWLLQNKLIKTDNVTKVSIPVKVGLNFIILESTVDSTCWNRDTLELHIAQGPPKPNAGEDRTIVHSNGSLSAKNIFFSSDTEGFWSGVTSTYLSDKRDPQAAFTNLPMGVNYFIWNIGNQACGYRSDTVKITRLEKNIPKAFTPNNDGNNETFFVQGLEDYSKKELVVFNRWGEEVYSNMKYNNEWKGQTNSGNNLPDDTYYYILKLEENMEIKSYVVIKR